MRIKLAERRAQLNMSQKRVSELADISDRHLRAIELGKANPTVDVAHRIAIALSCSIEEIFPLS